MASTPAGARRSLEEGSAADQSQGTEAQTEETPSNEPDPFLDLAALDSSLPPLSSGGQVVYERPPSRSSSSSSSSEPDSVPQHSSTDPPLPPPPPVPSKAPELPSKPVLTPRSSTPPTRPQSASDATTGTPPSVPVFDFNKFLEQMRQRSAEPVAKYLRRCVCTSFYSDSPFDLAVEHQENTYSFLKEFSKRAWNINDQIRVINDFLDVCDYTFYICLSRLNIQLLYCISSSLLQRCARATCGVIYPTSSSI
jgi:hypothetical protein